MGLLQEVGWIEHTPVIYFRETGRQELLHRGHNADRVKGLYLHDDACVRCRMEKAVKDAAFRIRCIEGDEMHVKPGEKRLLKFSKRVQEHVLGVTIPSLQKDAE